MMVTRGLPVIGQVHADPVLRLPLVVDAFSSHCFQTQLKCGLFAAHWQQPPAESVFPTRIGETEAELRRSGKTIIKAQFANRRHRR